MCCESVLPAFRVFQEGTGVWFIVARGFSVRLSFMGYCLLVVAVAQHSLFADVLTGEHYSMQFESADRETAELIGNVIDECWDEVAQAVGANAESPMVEVIIPASLEEFRRLARGRDERWVVGIAVHPGSLIVVKPPRLVFGSLIRLRQTVRHELTHVMLSRVSSMENMPRWLNEGIAMRVAGEMGTRAGWITSGAILRGALISLDKLDERFPDSHERAGLAYAESLSAVNYIADTYGEEALLELIGSLRNHDFDTALGASLGLDLDMLSEGWTRSIRVSPYVVTLVSSSLALWLMTMLVILAFIRKRRLARRKKWEWEMEEAMGDDF